MTLDDIIQALEANGCGGKDFLTGDTVIETAQLDEDINGGGGLTLSWKSDTGGVIPAGSTLLGYVMIEPYVPSLNEDGTFQWQPKFSEPAALLGKNYYSKDLVMRRVESYLADGSSYDGVVVAVVDTYSDLDDDGYDDGDLAIALDQRTLCAFAGGAWEDDSGPIPNIGDTYVDESTGYRWTWTVSGWVEGDIEVTSIYSHVFAGPVRTIVENMNVFIKAKMGNEWNIVLHDIDNTLANTNILCTFDGTTIKGALEEVANKAGEAYEGDGAVNLYYVGKTIHLGISKAYSADSYYNRFIILGGTRNMAKRVPAGNAYAAITQRMHIPEGTYDVDGDTVTVEEGSIIDMRGRQRDSIVPMERFLVWDDIYPKLNLKVASVTARLCYLLDDNGAKIPASDTPGDTNYKLYCKWYITLESDVGVQYFLDNRYIIQDKPLSILFQSGPLTGREFEVVYYVGENNPKEKSEDDKDDGHTPEKGEFRIVLQSDGDILLPTLPATYDNGGMCPNVGDWVTLVNVAIEDVFKERAQMDLLKKGYTMAKLISSGKQASWNETRTAPDVITGETGDAPSLGDTVGDVADGYVVTGIETNLVTGEKQYSWGTFKPHGLLASQIDKIGSLSLSGGEATFAPLVSAVNVGEAGQVIYVGNDYTPNGDGASQATSGKGSSQSATTAIRQAGGNVNIKTVYDAIAQVESGGNGAFAGLCELLEKHRVSLGSNAWSDTYLYFSDNTHNNGYWYKNGVLKYDGASILPQSMESQLTAAFASVFAIFGNEKTIKVSTGSNFHRDPNQYDLLIEPLTATFGEPGSERIVEGGIRAWLYDGHTWSVILNSTTALIDNNGEVISLVVFGGATQGEWIEASGILTTKNFVGMFATAQIDGVNMAEALFGMGILYHVLDQGVWRDVYYDSDADKWYYTGTNPLEEYTGSEDDIVPYSFSKMSADNIEFDGQTISLVSDYGVHFKDRSNTDALVVTGGGKVVMNDLSVTQIADIKDVLTVGDKQVLIRKQELTSLPADTQLLFRTFAEDSGVTVDKIIADFGMYEFGSSSPYATNSYFDLKSFESDWETDLGYISMRCGKATEGYHGHYLLSARSLLTMGVNGQENIRLLGDYVNNQIYHGEYYGNSVAVRGKFAIIESVNGTDKYTVGVEGTLSVLGTQMTIKGGIITGVDASGSIQGATGTFTDGGGNTITVQAGLITGGLT